MNRIDITNKDVINNMKLLKQKYKDGLDLSYIEKRNKGLCLSSNEEIQLVAWNRYSNESYIYDTYRQKQNDETVILFGDVESLNLVRSFG